MADDTQEVLKQKTRKTLIVVFVAIAALACSYFIWFGLINQLNPSTDKPSAWAEFGDFIGGLANPLVGLFALYWLTESIKVQRQELADTRSILNSQSDFDKKKNFESTFFSLLEHINSLHGRLKERQPDESSDLGYLHGIVFRGDSLKYANQELEDNNDICSHYFISLYQILKFIASHFQEDLRGTIELGARLERTMPSAEEKFYSNIVRASLDNRTAQLLAVNCFSLSKQNSFWLFKVLVERYSMLEHMPFSIKSSRTYHQGLVQCWTDFYQARAFGKSDYVSKLKQQGCAP
jgi:hypothetical protein